ncbi:MAG: hypothetical protein ABSD43_00305 [Terracidiphilus sp.]|jgi:hypothetical protein
MSPVGTHTHIRMGFRLGGAANLKPVWSPDSQTLLVNESRDMDNDTFDVYTLDVVTHKAKKKFKNVAPVYGWVEAK